MLYRQMKYLKERQKGHNGRVWQQENKLRCWMIDDENYEADNEP